MIYLIVSLAAFLLVILRWSFKNLPKEEYQVLAATKKNTFTYYGAIVASASVFGSGLFTLLASTLGVGIYQSMLILGLVWLAALPSARLIASTVEGGRGFTVGGASFVASLLMPLFILAGSVVGPTSVGIFLPLLAAMAVCLLLGEGIGRLACISFGCCYGRPINSVRLLSWLFGRYYFQFDGDTKKACYASKLKGKKLVPIQAITSIVYSICGLIGLALFSTELYSICLLFCVITHQSWRFISEFFRADFRGNFIRFSKYQRMSLIVILYAILLALVFRPDVEQASLSDSIGALWSPLFILALQVQWLIVFVLTGKSDALVSKLSCDVRE